MKRANGFTLIELLVGLAILGLIAGMLVAGLGTTGLMAQRARASSAALEPVAAAQLVLRGRLERLRAVPRLTAGSGVVDIAGTPKAFDFTGAPPDRDMPDALFRYRLALTTGGDVMLYATPVVATDLMSGAEQTRSWRAIRLAARATAIQLSYYGVDPLGGGQRWQDVWRDRPQPPDLIRVRVAFAPGDPRRWPDLIARPRATINNACRLDPVSGRCQSAA